MTHQGQSGQTGSTGSIAFDEASKQRPVTVSDKEGSQTFTSPSAAYTIRYDENLTARFCLSQEGKPSMCYIMMQPDFGFDGVQKVMLGGRGERGHYIALAQCHWEEKSCLWPHERLGQPAMLALVQKGYQPKVITVGFERWIIVGPYPLGEISGRLKEIKPIISDAKPYSESETR